MHLSTVPKANSILFIAPEFFNFHQVITERLEQLGFRVYFVADRPSQKAWMKILIRKARFLLGSYLWRFYHSRFSEIPAEEISNVFIIKGEAITPRVAKFLKQRFSRARFQLYLWDSLSNNPGAFELMPLMDRVLTFDYDDSLKHKNLELVSNFYIGNPSGENRLRSPEPPKWNLTFFGTAHADRTKVLAQISERLPKEFRFYRYLFFQSQLLFWARRLFDPYWKCFAPEEKNLKAKLGREWEEIASESVAILDIHHPRQSGLTIRAIESLARGLKLVTTNDRIRHYPFYDERLVRIIDRKDPQIDPEFLRERASGEPPPGLQDLELSRWLERILNVSI